MGHRCNYAIRAEGQVELFYSHWGALSVLQDVFWGPTFAEAFIRNNDPTESWLDEVFAEGGAALDKDTRTVVLFGDGDLAYPPLHGPFLELMAALWGHSSWTVAWARTGQPEIARAVGVDPASVGIDPQGLDEDELGDWGEAGCSGEAPAAPQSRREAHAQIARLLLDDQRLDAATFMGGILERLAPPGEAGQVKIAAGALRSPESGRPDADTAQALISLALALLNERS